MPSTFVLGGARSGKSAYAQSLAETLAKSGANSLVMIVTAEAHDAEMADRITRHRADRGDAWRTLEAPLALAHAIDALSANDVAVIDCLTLWLSNLMAGDDDIAATTHALLTSLGKTPANVIRVSNEVGQGIVPDNALARRFRDEAGRLHQRIAAQVERVVFVTAGLPQTLKPA